MTTLPTVLLPPPPADGGPNLAAIRIVLDHITAHPEEWDQTAWRCASGMCVAGTAAVLAGGTFPYSLDDHRYYPKQAEYGHGIVDTPDNQRTSIRDFAAEIFALDDYEADALFSPVNRLSDLERMAAQLAAGEDLDDPGDEYDDPDEGVGSI